jgi:hypothetical protein
MPEVLTMRTYIAVFAALLFATSCNTTSPSPTGGPGTTTAAPSAVAPSAPPPSTAAPIATPPKTMADVPVPSTSRISAAFSNGGTATAAGQTLTVALAGQSFDHPTEGGGFDLTFDPAVVQVSGVTVDAATWEFFTKNGTIDNARGTLTDLIFASFAGRSGNFPIATITFTTVAAGSPNLHLTESTVNPFASGGRRLAVALP